MGLFNFSKKAAAKDAIVLKIEGMHCGHCTSRVEAALSAIPGVKKVTVSLEKGTAEVIENVKGTVDVETMKAAVNELGFKA